MEMFGHAISASGLRSVYLPMKSMHSSVGNRIRSSGMDLADTRDMIDCALESLDIALIGKDDEVSRQVLSAFE